MPKPARALVESLVFVSAGRPVSQLLPECGEKSAGVFKPQVVPLIQPTCQRYLQKRAWD